MNTIDLMKKLERPTGRVDVVLDTDAYNEVDDQFALSYMLACKDHLCCKAIYAAPFFNRNSTSPTDGMEKSYGEILHLLQLIGRRDLEPCVYKGSGQYLDNEKTPVVSPAAEHLCRLAMEYSTEKPLYVLAIGAITNVASAILMKPEIIDHIVVIWLGGQALHWPDNREFNMMQDIAAARVVFGCGVPLVQIPVWGVCSSFTISEAEMLYWLKGKNPLCDYLVEYSIEGIPEALKGKPWARVICDVTAVSWLTGDFTESYIMPSSIPEYDHHYGSDPSRHPMRYVYHIKRGELVQDLFDKLSSL